MRRFSLTGFLVLGALAIIGDSGPAPAMAIMAPPPGPMRVKRAAVIVVGRIIALEPQDVQAPAFPKAGQKITYRIAVIKITEPIKGVNKGQETIRLGFIPPLQANPVNPANPGGQVKGPIRPFIRRRYSPNFTVGQDGLFYLNKHFQEPFYLAPMYFDFVASQNPNYATEVKQTKLTLKMGDNPLPALKSKDAEERFFAAALLIQKYRSFGRIVKTEAIDAEESKLILHALLEADWKQPGQLNPYSLFLRLGLTAKDGWNQPRVVRNIDEVHKAAKDWLRDHAASYRLQRNVIAAGPLPIGLGGGPIRPLPPVPPKK